ncbi:short-chain fatty acyl-CoA regulator family protein [Tistrella mobilis]|uniref:helix-turn-helix domain-containing protein n=1 Tax=Tistrella mobilis TaxID=171437 RepID=UPI0035586D3D
MSRTLTGMKIRTLRKEAGLTQGALARRAGISAAYLNLIEHHRRPVAGELLDRIARGIGVPRGLLDGGAERRLVDMLNEIAADPAVSDGAPPAEAAEELVGRAPGWAALLLGVYRAWMDQRQVVLAMADRLNHDPFLGESVHRILTRAAAVSSAAEILEGGDLEEADRARFTAIVASDSHRLAETAQRLAGFFDSAHMRVRSSTVMEHVDTFIYETGNHFPFLETAAEGFRTGLRRGETPEAAAAARLGIALPEDDPLTPERRRFGLLRDLAAVLAGDEIQAFVAAHPALGTDEARVLAAAALQSYMAAAIVMPYDRFLEAAERHRYDLDRLGRIFGVSYEQAAHRAATLRRPGAEGVRFAFMRSDSSGYVTKRMSLPRLPLPRYGNACPLWPIYGAFQTPGVTARAFGELPSGDAFLFFARAVEKRPPAADRPRHLLSVMLAAAATDADRLVQGDGIDRTTATIPLGTVCRLCPRNGCDHRQEAPLIT